MSWPNLPPPLKRILLIGLYMALIFGVIVAEIKYAERHPIVDQRR